MEITIAPWVRVLISLLKKCPNRRTRWSCFFSLYDSCRFVLHQSCCSRCHSSFPWNGLLQGPNPFWVASLFHTGPGYVPSVSCTQKSFQDCPFVKGAILAARFGSRCTNIRCKTQLYFIPWIPVQIAEKKIHFCHLQEIPGTVNQEDYVNIVSQHFTHQLRVYFVSLSYFLYSRVTMHNPAPSFW